MSSTQSIPGIENRLQLSRELRRELEELAATGYPIEACGLLIGRSDGNASSVEFVTAARNLNEIRPHDRYSLDPRDFLRAERLAAENGLDVVGIWHTHPDHPAVPSQTDTDAAWPDYSYIIVSVADGLAQETRSWRLNAGHFVEERLES